MTVEVDLRELDDTQARYLTLLVESGQKAKFVTELFGKKYVWMVDPETDHWYLERLTPQNA